MNAFRLRNRYSVRRRSESRDARGERSTTYVHQFYVWGEVPRSGSTGVRSDGGAQRSDTNLRFRVRYTPDIRVGDQMVCDSTVLYVQQALDLDGLKKLAQIVASQQPAEPL